MSTQSLYERAAGTLRDHLLKLMAQRNIPGLQVAVVRNETIELLDALGLANLEHQVPATHQSIFSINSMAKAFTGVALMQLVEAGQLDLSAPVSSYLDNLPESWRPITVRQLATLTSGLPEIMVYTADSSAALIGDGSEEGAWRAAYAAPFQFPAGKGFRYTQTNYALLGKVIDRLSGKPFTQFIAERQLAVAGMPNTLYGNDRDVLSHRANTYMCVTVEGDPTGHVTNSHINWPPVLRTAAGMHSTAEDLAHWVIALRRGVLLKNASSIQTLCEPPTLYDGSPGAWGIGWAVGRSFAGRVPAPGGGAKAQVVLYPDGLAVVLLTNLIGAFQEQLAAVKPAAIDLAFIDPIAEHYAS
jgi:CubicO group peptidase (beta-lactamase class C family)